MKARTMVQSKAVNVSYGFLFQALIVCDQELRMLDLTNWPAFAVKPLLVVFILMYVLPLSNGQ